MPELAEVEHHRRRWAPGLGRAVTRVELHPRARVFRGTDVGALQAGLADRRLAASESSGKQMLFRLGGDRWLGIHLGMTGELRVEPAGFRPGRHDHLVLHQAGRALVFSDPRMLGRVRFNEGKAPPAWWLARAPDILSAAFTTAAVAGFLRRRARSPIKAVLLCQEQFPGVGNWMADEILWRAAIHPRQPAGSLTPPHIRALVRECRWVCRRALRLISPALQDPPASWLFPHRWSDGGTCPRTGAPLVRESIGGRTTCWSPARQGAGPANPVDR